MTMHKIVKTALFTPGPKGWGLPVLFWGPPGVAKSDIIESVAREYQMHCERLSPGERGEAAFGVVPVPVTRPDGKIVLTQPPMDFVDIFDEEERGVLFVDELTTAPLAVQPALLGLVQARMLGSKFLGKGVRVIAAANPIGSAANGRELSKANANRMGHVEWAAPEVKEWVDWLLSHDAKKMSIDFAKRKSAEDEEKRVLGAWDREYSMAKGLIAGFMQKRPGLLHQEPTDDNPNAGRAWPSRRTWDLATNAIAGAAIHGLTAEDSMMLIASFVGDGAASELYKYRKEADLPDPMDVLDGKVKYAPDQEQRIDRLLAVLASCSSVLLAENCEHKQQRAAAFWNLVGKLQDEKLDVVLVAANGVLKAEIGTSDKNAIKIIGRIYPIVDATRK